MKPIVIEKARAAGRLLIKEVVKAAGEDQALGDREKGQAYRRDKVVGKAMYRFDDAMHADRWFGESGRMRIEVADYRRAVNKGIKQLVAIDTYKTKKKRIGDGNGIVTQKEVNAYPRTNKRLPLMAKTIVNFMIDAQKAGKVR